MSNIEPRQKEAKAYTCGSCKAKGTVTWDDQASNWRCSSCGKWGTKIK